MTFINSQLKEKVIISHEVKIGKLYFLENIVFSEIKEGKHLSIKSANEYLSLISEFYGSTKPFGYVSNRINTFSIEALDFPKFTNILKNLKVFVAVSYSHFDKMNMEIERQFCKVPYHGAENIIESYNYVNDYLKRNTALIA